MVSGIGGVVERGLWLLTRLTARIWPRSWITRFGSTMPPLSVFARGLPDCYRQVATGFDVLASRVVAGKVRPDDLSVAARSLRTVWPQRMPRAMSIPVTRWTPRGGGLPPESGFTYLDDVPARVMLDLAHRGARLAKEHGSSAGPPVSLLDQEVIQVSSADVVVGLPMRCVFALTAMGFLPQSAETISADELIRVRISPAWLRLDARFGSVYRHRGHAALVLR